MVQTQKVHSCQDCPFSNNDNEYGLNGCNIKQLNLDNWEQLPSDKVHDDCPLKVGEVIVKLKK
jgi:hypothetical protein